MSKKKIRTYYGEEVTGKELLELYRAAKEDYFKERRRSSELKERAVHYESMLALSIQIANTLANAINEMKRCSPDS